MIGPSACLPEPLLAGAVVVVSAAGKGARFFRIRFALASKARRCAWRSCPFAATDGARTTKSVMAKKSDKKREQKIVTIVIRYGQKVSNSRWHERLWDDGGVCDKIMISYQYRGRWSGGTGKNTYKFA